MNSILRTQIGLKALPQHGGANIGLVDAGTQVEAIVEGWSRLKILDGPMAGQIGWALADSYGPAPPPDTMLPVGVPGAWHMIFNDEFIGLSLDPKWGGDNWLGAPGMVTPPVNSKEVAAYDPNQVQWLNAPDGKSCLALVATAKPVTANGQTYPMRSGLIHTNGKFNLTYGCFEARLWLPAGPGVWPAFWTDGQHWPADGEIDVLEAYGTDASCSYHYHYPGGGPGGNFTVKGSTQGWHTYAADWEPGVITWYYDGEPVWQYTTGITSSPQFLVLNLAMQAVPTPASAVLYADYVRVWQKA